jgi:hypothetical protein
MSNVLDLSTADTSGFDPVPSGRYNVRIHEGSWSETKGKTEHNPDAKMPAGQPILKLQLRIQDEPYVNRVVFDQFVFPPNDYDKTKRDRMLGSFVRFLVAAGYDESEVKSKKFKLEGLIEDLQGRELVASVGQTKDLVDPENMVNNVKGYKKAGEAVGSTSTSGLL